MTKEERIEYNKKWYEKNKEKYKLSGKKREEKLLYLKEYREKNREKRKKEQKEWKEKNKKQQKSYLDNWRKENPKYKTEWYQKNKDKYVIWRDKNKHIIAWRSMVHSVIRRFGTLKEGKTIDILGYSSLDFKNHMEKLFTDGMSWDNWGEWHIDHIKPVSSFDKNTPISLVNSLDNLQPLWAKDNLSKSNKTCI